MISPDPAVPTVALALHANAGHDHDIRRGYCRCIPQAALAVAAARAVIEAEQAERIAALEAERDEARADRRKAREQRSEFGKRAYRAEAKIAAVLALCSGEYAVTNGFVKPSDVRRAITDAADTERWVDDGGFIQDTEE